MPDRVSDERLANVAGAIEIACDDTVDELSPSEVGDFIEDLSDCRAERDRLRALLVRARDVIIEQHGERRPGSKASCCATLAAIEKELGEWRGKLK